MSRPFARLLHHLALPGPFMAMEGAWMVVALGFLESVMAQDRAPVLPWLAALYPAAWLCGRLDGRLRGAVWLRFVALATLGVGALTAAAVALTPLPSLEWSRLGPVFAGKVMPDAARLSLSVLGAGFAIARGWLLSRRALDPAGFTAGFQVGAVVLPLVAFARQAVGGEDPFSLPGLLVFLGCGLFGMWLARWRQGELSERAGGSIGWPALTMVAIGVVLAGGVLLWRGLDPALMRALVAPVFWLWDMLVRLIGFLLSLLPPPDLGALPPPPVAPAGPKPPDERAPFLELSEIVHDIAQYAFAISIIGLVGAALLRNLMDLLRWLARRGGGTPGVAYGRSSAELLADLREAWRALLRGLRRLVARLAALPRGKPPPLDPPTVRAVRDLYAGLLAWARARGVPRARGQTPAEFLATLRRGFPERGDDLARVTEAYMDARYAERVPTPATVREARAAWRRARRWRRATTAKGPATVR